MQTTVNQRIEILIKELKMNTNSFAKGMSMANTGIYNITGERQTKPGFELIELICKTYGVNPAWLITGEGEILVTKEEKQIIGKKPESSELLEELRSSTDYLKKQLDTVNRTNEFLQNIISSKWFNSTPPLDSTSSANFKEGSSKGGRVLEMYPATTSLTA